MKKLALIFACCALFAAFALWDYTDAPKGGKITTAQTEAAVARNLTNIDKTVVLPLAGQPFRLTMLEGKTVLVNFWATWCTPCAQEFPVLLAFAEQHPAEVTLLAVSVDEDPQNIAPFFAKLGLSEKTKLANVVLATDPQKRLAEQFQSFQYPETYVLTPALKLQQKLVGKVTAEGLQKILK